MSTTRQHRYTSPEPHPTTMTPPPSSSAAATQATAYKARTPTPTHSHLSSPPPTIKAATARRRAAQADPDLDLDSASITSESDSASGIDKLRAMLADAREECNAAKTSAAHYRFQFELVKLDSSECMNRMGVELNMTEKEIDVLQQANLQPMPISIDTDLLEWKNRCMLLEAENQDLRERLADAKALIVERDDQNAEQTDKLKKRIRDNRTRLNQLRSSGSLFGEVLRPVYNAHLQRDNSYTSPTKPRSDDPFGNLLLADQVLRNQEAASTPSTPARSRPLGPLHVRGRHSLASLPSTPYRSAPRSQQLYTTTGQQQPMTAPPQKRRRSRDSTISASDMDDPQRVPDSEGSVEPEVPEDREVYGSQASQEAANMLRRAANLDRQPVGHSRSQSMKEISGRVETSTRPSSGAFYGYQITKPGPGATESIKRRFYDDGPAAGDVDVHGKIKKKGRTSRYDLEGDNVGLGLSVELGMGSWVGTK